VRDTAYETQHLSILIFYNQKWGVEEAFSGMNGPAFIEEAEAGVIGQLLLLPG
jgi:hypothetical protein